MRPRRLLAPVMAILLLIPATTAYADDQTVEVFVSEPNVLSVSVDNQGGFGVLLPGATGQWGFNLNVWNTTDSGWIVTADSSGDFVSGNWEYCDESGCHNWLPDGVATMPISSLSITGGDLPWWDDVDTSVIEPLGGTFGSGAVTVNTGTSDAWGSFTINEPNPELTLDVPVDATTGLQYMTTLTYTIAANP